MSNPETLYTVNSNGVITDLSLIFEPFSGGVKSPLTGYNVSGYGDLNNIFDPSVNGQIITYNTNYCVNGIDLRYFFAAYNPYTVTGTHTISSDASYNTIITFTSNGTIIFNKNIGVVSGKLIGGGAGGTTGEYYTSSSVNGGNGGGGGQIIIFNTTIYTIGNTNYITIGNGGLPNANGSASIFQFGTTFTAFGGQINQGGAGGSGGSSLGGNGSHGSNGPNQNTFNAAGGGGGGGGAGFTTVPGQTTSGSGGSGGNTGGGGGGNGGSSTVSAQNGLNGAPNSGAGGGGGGGGNFVGYIDQNNPNPGLGGSGGSGIVIIEFNI